MARIRRHVREPDFYMELTAAEEICPTCSSPLQVLQHRDRSIQRLDGLLYLLRRNRACPNLACPNERTYRVPEDIRLALPRMTFGTDVVLAVGDRHLRQRQSLSLIGRELTASGVAIDQTHVGRLLRVYVSLEHCTRGREEQVIRKLRAQGGILLMADAVQHDGHEPPLYVAWDAISGTPLFGERRESRGKEDLVELLERVKAMEVPVIATVSDKETGLLPAMAAVFPGAPQQYCQTHYLKNCAEPLKPDLNELGKSVKRRAKAVQNVTKLIRGRRRRAALKKKAEVVATEASPKAAGAANPGAVVAAAVALVTASATIDPGSPVEPSGTPCVVDQPATAATPEGATVAVTSLDASQAEVAPIDETELAYGLCELARENARRSGKAPLDPPELRRHEELERVRTAVEAAIKLRESAETNPTLEPEDVGTRQEAPFRSRQAGEGTGHRLARNSLRRTSSATRRDPARDRARDLSRLGST